jgi:hypothetical protein
MKSIKLFLFILLLFFLWIPIIQQNTKCYDEPKLKGAYVGPIKPVCTIELIKTFQYQKQIEDYLNYQFGFRGLLVKIKNSLAYLFWKEIPVADNIEGKDGYVFSIGSIYRSIGLDYNGKEKNDATIKKIKFLKEGLEKQGTHFLAVMAPSKESTMPERMPSKYNNQIKKNNDYLDFISGYKKNNIDCLDLCSYFRKINKTSPYPLYTKTSFHWSVFGASIAQDTLLNYISTYFDKPLPSYTNKGVEISDTSRLSDDDFEDPMNFLFKLGDAKYAYPKLKMVEASKKNFRPKVIIIGDSYFFQIQRLKMLNSVFSEESKFWFYFATTSYSLNDVTNEPLFRLNIMKEIQTADLVILIGYPGTLDRFPFGFTDYYYDNIDKKNVLESIEAYIKSQPKWLDNLNKLKLASKKGIDELVIEEVKSVCRDKIMFNLQSANSKFISADVGHNNILMANREKASEWESFSYFDLGENKIAISSFQDKFLSAELNNKNIITASRDKIGEWEVFAKTDLGDGYIAIKAANGKYLSFDEKTSQLFAIASSIGNKEKFKLSKK